MILPEVASKRALKCGVLIAVEGIDGAGKTTQSRLLIEKLKEVGYPVIWLHEPTNGKWGQKIRDLAKNGRHNTTPEEELYFFYQDRIEDVNNNILPGLKEKNIVVMDRYYFSSIAYQGARGLDVTYVEKKNEEIAPPPDILVLLDISPTNSLKRIRASRPDGPNHFETREYLEKVRVFFLQNFSKRKYTLIIDGDGSRSEKEIFSDLWAKIQPKIKIFEES